MGEETPIIGYFNEKKWNDITREERFFCAELYFKLKENIEPFLELCNTKITEEENKLKKPYDIGYEVCFYRDMLKLYNIDEKIFLMNIYKSLDERTIKLIKNNKPLNEKEILIKIKKSLTKRTFDIALFSNKEIHIFEAKCHQGFKTEQLNEFRKDEKYIKILFNQLNKNVPNIYLWAIISSNYHPKKETIEIFNNRVIYWNEIPNYYKKNDSQIFILADNKYERNKKRKSS